ncbi:MAG: hypothetical protein H0V82_03520 [Candidatus Protochlamydia sp.]|nr:hypothetical protein [Candidatus Protochlamydia sp.]
MNSPRMQFSLSSGINEMHYSKTGYVFKGNYDQVLENESEGNKLIKELEIIKDSKKISGDNLNAICSFICFLTRKGGYIDKEKLPLYSEAFLQIGSLSTADDLILFQAIINSIYEQLPIKNHKCPIGMWKKNAKGPCTLTPTNLEGYFSNQEGAIGIVCLPQEYRYGGISAWSSLWHEVAGHNFLQSIPGLIQEIENKIKDQETYSPFGNYWSLSKRVEEVASDVMATLTAGPSFALASLVYFRGASQEDSSKLFQSDESNCHPIPALRIFVMTEVIKLLKLDANDNWRNSLEAEIQKDLATTDKFTITNKFGPGLTIPKDEAITTTKKIANIVATTSFSKFNNQSLFESLSKSNFCWNQKDESLMKSYKPIFSSKKINVKTKDLQARHIVAATVMASCEKDANIKMIFNKMKEEIYHLFVLKK